MRTTVLATLITLLPLAVALALPSPIIPASDNAGLVESKRDDVPVQGEAIGAMVAAAAARVPVSVVYTTTFLPDFYTTITSYVRVNAPSAK